MRNIRYGVKLRIAEVLKFVFLGLVYVALQVLTTFIGRIPKLAIYNGVVVCFQFLTLVLMIRINAKRGRRISWVCLFFSMALLILAMFQRKTLMPLPGFFMISLFAFMATLMSFQIETLDKRMIADYVTSLHNSRGLTLAIRNKIYDKENFFVIYIELENFKFLNDSYGFDYGDELRKIVTKRINGVVKNCGIAGCVDRSGFVIILNGDCDAKQITAEAIRSIGEKISIKKEDGEVDCFLTAYAGITKCPDDAIDAETLMKFSDIAMYHASTSKKERIVFFNPSMEAKLKRQIEVEKIIKKALANDSFYLVYQPQFSTKEKKLRGFEALLRLRGGDGKKLSPTEFIPAAEKNDLILEITDWVLQEALKTFAPIVKDKDITISINVSSKNMESGKFVEDVQRILKKTQFPAKKLEIEITEYCLLQSFEKTIENIKALRKIGVQVALDDFGTGYSSLSYLEKLPINLLKVDKSLVDDIERNFKSQQFVNAVIYMGHLMGCEVICEGVESEGQLRLLKDNQSDFIQGYIWGRPMEFNKACELVNA